MQQADAWRSARPASGAALVVALAVAVLHIALLLAWTSARLAAPWAERSAPERRDAPIAAIHWWRLLPAEPEPATADQPAPPRAPAPLRARGPLKPPTEGFIAVPPVIEGPAPTLPGATPVGPTAGTSIGPAVTPPSVAPAASSAAGHPALDLRLPPPALRGAPPAGPPPTHRPRSVESTIARDFDNGPMVEENLGDGRRRFRQGRRCIEARDSRMAQVDPIGQSGGGIPKQIEDCSR